MGPREYRCQYAKVQNDIDICLCTGRGHMISFIVDHRCHQVLCIGTEYGDNFHDSSHCYPLCAGSPSYSECSVAPSFHDNVCETYQWEWCDLQKDGEGNCQTWPLLLAYAVVFEHWKPIELGRFFTCFVSNGTDITYQFVRFLHSLAKVCGVQPKKFADPNVPEPVHHLWLLDKKDARSHPDTPDISQRIVRGKLPKK